MKLKNIGKVFGEYPYNTLQGKISFLDFLILKAFPERSFPSMNIIPDVMKYYGLTSLKEFMDRYHLSQVDFEKIWASKERTTQRDIENFYNEHDADVWRQAYLSKYSYMYKRKILRAFHVARQTVREGDRVFDFGCGAGALGHYLAKKGMNVDVYDIPSPHLDFVKKAFSGLVRSVSFPNEKTYRVVFALDVLEHTTNPLELVKIMTSMIAVGGLFVVSFPKEDDFSCAHIEIAQDQRDSVFHFLNTNFTVLSPGFIYKK